jgi:hypothetical protein
MILWRVGVLVRLRACAACLAYDGAPVTVRNGAAVAQKVQTLFIDDLDGSAAEGTVAQQLRDALAAYVRAGRLCVPRISSMALTSRVALAAVPP